MERYKIIEVKESVFANNDREAARLREDLKRDKTFLLNLMSSPGSGKTTTLLRTIETLKDELRMGVMEADIDSDVDAEKIAGAGVKSIQLHTGGMCHLDAGMTEQGLREIGTGDLDLVVLENVGNLVCPAEFDTGAVKNAMILSVPEGHDKPLKYPLIFTVCDALIINKIDVLPYFDFDMDKAALIGPAPYAARFAADMRTTHSNFGLLVDLSLWSRVTWSGYVLGALAVAYVLLALPLWFRRPNPVVLLPVDFVAVGLYLLYINLKTGGGWFLSFAFPVTGIACLLTTTVVALAHYLRRGYFFIFGGASIAVGCSAMLVELFQCITFGGEMFRWSLYPVGVLSSLGLLWILAGIIRPLGDAIRKRIFI